MLKFGIFNEFWNGQPNHLPLLNLNTNDCSEEWNFDLSIEMLNRIIEKNSEEQIIQDVKLLLKEFNWRPHLVACFVVLKIKSIRAALINDLWERILKGSWVSPQIIVTLSKIDSNFNQKANELVASGNTGFNSKFLNNELSLEESEMSSTILLNKATSAALYLVSEYINSGTNDDGGAEIAKYWEQRLSKLVDQVKIIF